MQNNPVPFANVMNTRDKVGTYTDIRGNFNLVSTDSVLNVQIKSLGYVSDNYKLVPSSQSPTLVLKEDNNAPRKVLAANQTVVSHVIKKDTTELEEPEVGWEYYNTYVANNLQIPDNIRKKSTLRNVELSFDIDKAGHPSNIKVTKSSQCKECDEEAIRLLKEGPKWKRKGKKSKTSISIAVDQK
jgi:TonB family protein